jgi:hypothetical protein
MNTSKQASIKTIPIATGLVALLLAIGILISPTSGAASTVDIVSPARGNVELSEGQTFVLTVDATDDGDGLHSLEVDHSHESDPNLPEFAVYANEADPWSGGVDAAAAKALFDDAGVTVAYNQAEAKWVIDFGTAITNRLINEYDGVVTFYLALNDSSDNYLWGNMTPTTPENRFAYTLSYSEVTVPGVPVTSTVENSNGLNLTALTAAGIAVVAIAGSAVLVRAYIKK